MNLQTLEALGGLDGLRRIVTVFYDHVFPDPMIGYLFDGLDLATGPDDDGPLTGFNDFWRAACVQ